MNGIDINNKKLILLLFVCIEPIVVYHSNIIINEKMYHFKDITHDVLYILLSYLPADYIHICLELNKSFAGLLNNCYRNEIKRMCRYRLYKHDYDMLIKKAGKYNEGGLLVGSIMDKVEYIQKYDKQYQESGYDFLIPLDKYYDEQVCYNIITRLDNGIKPLFVDNDIKGKYIFTGNYVLKTIIETIFNNATDRAGYYKDISIKVMIYNADSSNPTNPLIDTYVEANKLLNDKILLSPSYIVMNAADANQKIIYDGEKLYCDKHFIYYLRTKRIIEKEYILGAHIDEKVISEAAILDMSTKKESNAFVRNYMNVYKEDTIYGMHVYKYAASYNYNTFEILKNRFENSGSLACLMDLVLYNIFGRRCSNFIDTSFGYLKELKNENAKIMSFIWDNKFYKNTLSIFSNSDLVHKKMCTIIRLIIYVIINTTYQNQYTKIVNDDSDSEYISNCKDIYFGIVTYIKTLIKRKAKLHTFLSRVGHNSPVISTFVRNMLFNMRILSVPFDIKDVESNYIKNIEKFIGSTFRGSMSPVGMVVWCGDVIRYKKCNNPYKYISNKTFGAELIIPKIGTILLDPDDDIDMIKNLFYERSTKEYAFYHIFILVYYNLHKLARKLYERFGKINAQHTILWKTSRSVKIHNPNLYRKYVDSIVNTLEICNISPKYYEPHLEKHNTTEINMFYNRLTTDTIDFDHVPKDIGVFYGQQ